jgi:hypothetical protein
MINIDLKYKQAANKTHNRAGNDKRFCTAGRIIFPKLAFRHQI